MHKILVRTELPRLRELGYEVFNPPYLSDIKDQSAEVEWDSKQKTSLPPEVFEKLSKYNFYYNGIDSEIANILNQYFDAVIVTIHTDWLLEILKAYKGKIIFRTYGQMSSLSDLLFRNGAFQLICQHHDFSFVPHALESIDAEHSWLKARATVIPYCLTGDIFKFQDTYSLTDQKSNTVAVSCPNIRDQFYNLHYKFLKRHLSDETYKIYGVQLGQCDDPQIVGTIPRADLISRFQQSNAYLYTYNYPHVCYLPPIEMMILGGPVVFLKGSLLDKYFGSTEAPGRASSIEDAKNICSRLLHGDTALARQIIESQASIRQRYQPEYVWPIFDTKMKTLLSEKVQHTNPLFPIFGKTNESPGKQEVFLFHHFPGECVHFSGINYSAFDGIPRVMRLIVEVLIQSGNYSVRITARKDQVQNFIGFFNPQSSPDCQILCIDDLAFNDVKSLNIIKKIFSSLQSLRKKSNLVELEVPNQKISLSKTSILTPKFSSSERIMKFLVYKQYFTLLSILVIVGAIFRPFLRAIQKLLRSTKSLHFIKDFLHWYKDSLKRGFVGAKDKLSPLMAVNFINRYHPDAKVIIPHYHLFPECLELNEKTVMYLPDYTPHFFESTGEFGSHLQESAIGQGLVRKCSAVFTNSHYSQSYLPDTRLQVPANKIKMFYLPNLNVEKPEAPQLSSETSKIKNLLNGYAYLFYPTQPRPNKKIDLLLRVFDSLANEYPNLKLVLTSHLVPGSDFEAVYDSMQFKNRVLIFPHVSDEALSWLYKSAAAMILTSVMEGNFPPQVFEALVHRIPIVATRLPLITERLNHLEDNLLLCKQNSFDDFYSATLKCLKFANEVIDRQEPVRDLIIKQGSMTTFSNEVISLLNSI